MPGKERAELREGGALPISFFDKKNEVSLWPHEIDYQKGTEIAKTIAERPGDVPVFFGFPPSENGAEIDERTAEIVSILDSTMVHVVFLDDADASGKIEYGHFGSFRSIIDWSRSLVKVLRTRFVGEVNLHRMENVLVIVCRGQQIRITEEECREFESLIGENPNDAPVEELRPFVSCYFLNRELSIDDGGVDIYASNVWDIVVGRLLKSFVLSREQHLAGSNSEKTIWMRPGTRIWKTEECYMAGAEDAIRRTTENVLAKVDAEARDAVVDAVGGMGLSAPYEGCPGSSVQADAGLDFEVSWDRVDAATFAKGVENSPARAEGVARSAEAYFSWRRGNDQPDDSEINRVFNAVKADPRQLFACSREVDLALRDDSRFVDEAKTFKSLVAQMAHTEEQRKGLIAILEKMADQFRLAQRHYVGSGTGLFVVAAVTAMCGATLWQVITLLGGSLFTVLWLLAAAAVGSLAAMVAIVAIHYHAGSSAAEAYLATCRELDEVSARRHNEARQILCAAVRSRLENRRRNARLKVHDLLARIRDVLVREIQYHPAKAAQAVDRHEKRLSKFAREQRCLYLQKTRSDAPTSAASVRTSDAEENLLGLWKMGEQSFHGIWKQFCSEYDVKSVGHLPVSVFIPMTRNFMTRFMQRAREIVRLAIDDSCAQEKKIAVMDWIARSERVLLYSGKAKINNNASRLKRQVFVARDMQSGFFNEVRSAGDHTVSTEFFESQLMMCAEGAPLAFAIREVPISLKSEPETGVLALRQAAEDAR